MYYERDLNLQEIAVNERIINQLGEVVQLMNCQSRIPAVIPGSPVIPDKDSYRHKKVE